VFGVARTPIAPKRRSATFIGRSGTVRWVVTNRRSAADDSGSRSSTGPDVPGTIGVASCWGPSPIRTTPKSASPGRRSQIRSPATSDHSASGGGPPHWSRRRWASAVARTVARMRSR
jgi:hypothetical protein